jgi:subtilisin family serine protease
LLDLVGWTNPAVSCLRTGTLGLIDTVVEGHHPAFADRDVVVRSMLPAGIEPAEVRHGTAIGTRLVSLAPGAGLRVAAVFRQRDDETTDTTAEWLVLAIDWLLREDVDVINLSLGGPDNRLLEAAVSLALDRNVGIVAAVGDGGPGSVPVHPSAWPGVIGVTAVDRDRNVYRQARQGSEVDIAAPGVDLPMLGAEGTETYLTGTSYAAPFVTAAWLLAGGAEPVFDLAQDLGDPGRDDVYGAGLLRFDRLCRR